MKRSQIVLIAVIAVLSAVLFGWGAVAGADVMGIAVADGAAGIEIGNQPVSQNELIVSKVVAPTDAFVVVHESEDGMPGMLLGYEFIEKGTARNVGVALEEEPMPGAELLVALHVDHGMPGEFEFDMDDMLHSPDRPFMVQGAEVAEEVRVAGR